MKVFICGYVLGEGRFSMVRAARTIHKYLVPLCAPGDTVTLDEPTHGVIAPAPDCRSLSVKWRKRVLLPLRLRLKSYDVLHVIDNDYAAAIPPAALLRTVVTCHDMMPFLLTDDLRDAFHGRMGLELYKKGLANMARCARVVCDSHFTRDCVLKYTSCPDDRTQVIYLAVDDCFKPLGPDHPDVGDFARHHGLEAKQAVLNVGSTDPYKNLETVLTVFRKLMDKLGDDLVLLKVGRPFTAGQESLIAQLGLADHIVHLSGLSEQELVWAYNASSLLLCPSHFEGFGLPVLEAMACGTPVVCSNGGSLREIAANAAATHDPQDLDGLFESCRRVLGDERYAAQLREKGRRHAAEFTWTRTASEYYNVYKETLAE